MLFHPTTLPPYVADNFILHHSTTRFFRLPNRERAHETGVPRAWAPLIKGTSRGVDASVGAEVQ